MHILIGLIAAATAVYFFFIRARHSAEIATEVADMAQTALGAARRYGFRRRAERHPVDCVEETEIAVAGVATAYLALDGFPTEEARNGLLIGLQSEFGGTLKEAEELAALGQWLVNACNGADAAVPRLARRLKKIAGPPGLVAATGVIGKVAEASKTGTSEGQIDALSEIQRIFKA